MIQAELFFQGLQEAGIDFFTGVPDSLLKDFCAYITDHAEPNKHVIAANEGNALAIAAGHFLGTGRAALVYLQNSGLGNTVNPLLSLNDPEVYGVPALLVIGWRGELGLSDEPQHVKQGRVTLPLLKSMEVPYQILNSETPDVGAVIAVAVAQMEQTQGPAALVVQKGTFERYIPQNLDQNTFTLNREEVIQRIVDRLGGGDRVVATTGMISRELYEYRDMKGGDHSNDFLTVGSMGHASSIALGLSRSQPQNKIFCLDGDGSVLMHMGALAIIGQSDQKNFVHIVLNNGAHDSVGGQQTVGFSIDLASIARSCGYRKAFTVTNYEELDSACSDVFSTEGPSLLDVRVRKGARTNLGRPKSTPKENRDALMYKLRINQK